jgi:cytochrome c peroxidase
LRDLKVKRRDSMKIFKTTVLSFIVAGLGFFPAFTADTVVKGNVEKGKILFNDTNFGNGTSGKSCNSCHPNGRGLNKAGEKKKFNIMGQRQNSLEEAVNFCIKAALKGEAIDPESEDMANIIAYITSLK